MKNLNRFASISRTLLFCGVITLAACNDNTFEEIEHNSSKSINKNTTARIAANDFESSLVKRWAPIHYMDVDATGKYAEGGTSDYITAIDYDGDWLALNNWDNLPNLKNNLAAHCYYSVTETNTHWFIIYAFFHPRDWTDNIFLYTLDQHENDLEGMIMAVEKDGTAYGKLLAGVSVSHSDFFSFTTFNSNLTNGRETIDGALELIEFNGDLHPVTAQEAKGHSLKAWPQHDINGDGIIYYPSMNDIAEIPADNYDSHVEYKLVNILETGGLWDQRFNTDLFYDVNGSFKGDVGSGGANAPWAWNDGNDGPVNGGDMAYDPANLFDIYFDGFSKFSHHYINNKYDSNRGGIATIYEHCGYAGYAVALKEGSYNLVQLEALGVKNDDISSIRLEAGYKATFYKDAGFAGASINVSTSQSCLNNFNDEASSIIISKN